VVGGLSFGGLLSMHLALAQPQRVRALLLVDTGPGFKNPEAQAGLGEDGRAARLVRRAPRDGRVRGPRRGAGRRQRTRHARGTRRHAAIAAQTPHGIANFARRVAGPASPTIDRSPRSTCPRS
jgi:pimeloyl-ACP methyl ester carboxylesterase